MRTFLVLTASIWLVACASEPSVRPQVAEVPMYTPGEWSEMTSVCTVPEFAESRALHSSGGLGFGMHIHHSSHMHFHMHSH